MYMYVYVYIYIYPKGGIPQAPGIPPQKSGLKDRVNYVYIYIYVYVYVCVYIYIYIYRERDREIDIRTCIYIYIYIYMEIVTQKSSPQDLARERSLGAGDGRGHAAVRKGG